MLYSDSRKAAASVESTPSFPKERSSASEAPRRAQPEARTPKPVESRALTLGRLAERTLWVRDTPAEQSPQTEAVIIRDKNQKQVRKAEQLLIAERQLQAANKMEQASPNSAEAVLAASDFVLLERAQQGLEAIPSQDSSADVVSRAYEQTTEQVSEAIQHQGPDQAADQAPALNGAAFRETFAPLLHARPKSEVAAQLRSETAPINQLQAAVAHSQDQLQTFTKQQLEQTEAALDYQKIADRLVPQSDRSQYSELLPFYEHGKQLTPEQLLVMAREAVGEEPRFELDPQLRNKAAAALAGNAIIQIEQQETSKPPEPPNKKSSSLPGHAWSDVLRQVTQATQQPHVTMVVSVSVVVIIAIILALIVTS